MLVMHASAPQRESKYTDNNSHKECVQLSVAFMTSLYEIQYELRQNTPSQTVVEDLESVCNSEALVSVWK